MFVRCAGNERATPPTNKRTWWDGDFLKSSGRYNDTSSPNHFNMWLLFPVYPCLTTRSSTSIVFYNVYLFLKKSMTTTPLRRSYDTLINKIFRSWIENKVSKTRNLRLFLFEGTVLNYSSFACTMPEISFFLLCSHFSIALTGWHFTDWSLWQTQLSQDRKHQ